MTYRLPPLNALRAFEAAARHLSFKDAGAELSVTPTAISHQIRGLEEYLGFQVFQAPDACAGSDARRSGDASEGARRTGVLCRGHRRHATGTRLVGACW
jgi:hypothetical protein